MKERLTDIDQNKLLRKLFSLNNPPTSSTIKVLYKLIDYFNVYGTCCPSNERLAAELNLSTKSIERAVTWLKKHKVVSVKIISKGLKTLRVFTRIGNKSNGQKIIAPPIKEPEKKSKKIFIRTDKIEEKATDKTVGLNNKLSNTTEHNKKQKEKQKDNFSLFFFHYNCTFSSNRLGRKVQDYWRDELTRAGYTNPEIMDQIIAKHLEKYRGAPDLIRIKEHYRELDKSRNKQLRTVHKRELRSAKKVKEVLALSEIIAKDKEMYKDLCQKNTQVLSRMNLDITHDRLRICELLAGFMLSDGVAL